MMVAEVAVSVAFLLSVSHVSSKTQFALEVKSFAYTSPSSADTQHARGKIKTGRGSATIRISPLAWRPQGGASSSASGVSLICIITIVFPFLSVGQAAARCSARRNDASPCAELKPELSNSKAFVLNIEYIINNAEDLYLSFSTLTFKIGVNYIKIIPFFFCLCLCLSV